MRSNTCLVIPYPRNCHTLRLASGSERLRCFHFPGAWTSLAALNGHIGSALADDAFISTVRASSKKSKQQQPLRIRAYAAAGETLTEDNIFANSCDIEDTDLYFLLQECPPPQHIISWRSCSPSSTHYRHGSEDEPASEVRPRKLKSMAILHQGGWNNLSRNTILRVLTQLDAKKLPLDVISFMATSSSAHASTRATWGTLVAAITSQSPTKRLPQKSSLHERLELLFRGHTMRRRSPLWISLATIRSMQLSIVPCTTWFRCDATVRDSHSLMDDQQCAEMPVVLTSVNVEFDDFSAPSFVEGQKQPFCEAPTKDGGREQKPRIVKKSKAFAGNDPLKDPAVVLMSSEEKLTPPRVCVTLEDILASCSNQHNGR